MNKSIIAVAIAASITSVAIAAPAEGAPAAECDGIKVATGPKGKGYSALFADINKVCGAKVKLCEVNTSGGLDNLNALSVKDADVGFVQLDTWNDMKNGDENIANLQYIMGMNSNFLHVVTASSGFAVVGDKKFGILKGDTKQVVIGSFSDLRGQTVALVGSAQLLGRRLNQQLGYGMQFIDAKNDDEAFAMVKSGRVAAAFTVSGWPSGTVKNIPQNSGLTMVPFNAIVSEPYRVKPLNYKNLAVYNNNALAIQNVFVTRQFSGQRATNVNNLKSCIQQNLSELKEGNFQPAWNEINNTAVNGMTAFGKK